MNPKIQVAYVGKRPAAQAAPNCARLGGRSGTSTGCQMPEAGIVERMPVGTPRSSNLGRSVSASLDRESKPCRR